MIAPQWAETWAPKWPIRFDEEPHAYYYQGRRVPNVTAILEEWGFGLDVSSIDPEVLASARERGRYVHKAAELLAEGRLDTGAAFALQWGGYLRALVAAWASLRLRPLLAEVPLYEPSYDYAGTLDFFGWSDGGGRLVLLDYSTGAKPGGDAQLAAYRHLLQRNLDRLEGQDISAAVVHLRENGSWRLEPIEAAELELAFHDFAAMRRLTARRARNRRGHVGSEEEV
jgi:hypothetical protein